MNGLTHKLIIQVNKIVTDTDDFRPKPLWVYINIQTNSKYLSSVISVIKANG